jgi:hypothetical protein
VLREKEAKQRRAPVDSERDRRSDLRIFSAAQGINGLLNIWEWLTK